MRKRESISMKVPSKRSVSFRLAILEDEFFNQNLELVELQIRYYIDPERTP